MKILLIMTALSQVVFATPKHTMHDCIVDKQHQEHIWYRSGEHHVIFGDDVSNDRIKFYCTRIKDTVQTPQFGNVYPKN